MSNLSFVSHGFNILVLKTCSAVKHLSSSNDEKSSMGCQDAPEHMISPGFKYVHDNIYSGSNIGVHY